MNSHNTAMSRVTASRPVKKLFERGAFTGKVLDYGCGKGKDIEYLLQNGIDAIGYDPFYKPIVLVEKYNTIICNYVVNVLSDINERAELFRCIFDQLQQGGKLFISARNTKEINTEAKKGNWQPFNDGFITGKKTFQKGIDFPDMMAYFDLSGIYKDATIEKVELGLHHTTTIMITKR